MGAIAWRRVPEYAPAQASPDAGLVLSGSAYSTDHPTPYVYEVPRHSGAVLIYGAAHIKDPAHPQAEDIRGKWEAFAPTVALVESRLGVMFPMLMDPVRTFGEPGLVHALARRAGVPTYTWEPPVGVVVRSALDQGMTREQAGLRFVLMPYFSNLRHGRPGNPEAFVRDTFRDRMRWPGIEGVFADLDAMQAAWDREFPEGPDWRDVSDEYGLPGGLGAADLNLPRDLHMLAIIDEMTAQGERVFVVCGSSHAVKVEPALRPGSAPTDAEEKSVPGAP